MTRPVLTSAICPGAIRTSCAAARSNPAASSVPYPGRVTVGSSRRIFSRMSAAYLLLLVLFTAAASAQDRTGASPAPDQAGAAAQNLTAPLPLDPAVRTGTLPNGLTFFIRRNAQPENRVLLRLAVKAG